MSHHFEILTELPYSGKTDTLIAAYLQQLDKSGQAMEFGSSLWLTPTFRSRRNILNRILGSDADIVFAPNVYTFDQFADAILDAQLDSSEFLNPIQKRILVRSIIQDLHREGRLQHFGQIHHTSGFVDLIVGFLSEIKRDEIWPDDLEKSFQRRTVGPKERELHLIYKVYQERLQELGSYDAEGRFWLARTHILEGRLSPFDQLQFVVVDGFSDFTRTQHEILDLLAQRLERVIISLPYEAGHQRQMLFAKSRRTMERFQRNATFQHHTTESLRGSIPPEYFRRSSKPKREIPKAMQTIASHVFTTQAQDHAETDAEGLEIIAIAGLKTEYDVLAERVKRLLVEGVAADDIVVVFRSLKDVAIPFSSVLRDAGIPFSCETQDALTNWPIVRFLRLFLKLEQEDWSYDSLSRLLRSNYFSPSWEDLVAGVSSLLSQMRARNILGGRRTILGSLERRLEFLAANDDVDTLELESTRAAFAIASRLDEITEPFRTSASFHEWLERLRQVLDTCCSSVDQDQSDDSSNFEASHNRMEQLFEILFDAARFMDESHQEASRSSLSLSEFADYLNDLISSFSTTVSQDMAGTVRVLAASEVRNLDVPYLFLAGMNEGNFPSTRGESCLFNEADRQWLNESGVTLPTTEVQLQDEMLLFYNVVTRARKRLTFTYCSTSSKGQPLYPSPFVSAVRTLFKPESIRETTIEHWTPVTDEESAISQAQLRTTAISQALSGQPELFTWLLGQSDTNSVSMNLLAAARANAQRFEQTGMTAYEGMLSEKAANYLRKHFDEQYQFSATQLEGFATCPFRFLMSNVMKIEPLNSPATGTNYMKRGLVVHEAFSKLYSDIDDWTEEEALATEGISEKLTSLIHEISSQSHSASPLEKTLHQLETELMSQWANLYSDQWNSYFEKTGALDNGFRPTAVEVPFGDVQLESDEAARTTYPALKMGSDESPVYVQGRIDRIDVGTQNEKTVYNVVDYKTGSPKTFNEDDIRHGLALQLALYTVAVHRLKLLGNDAVPYQMGYWAVKEKGFFAGVSRTGGGKELKALREDLVAEIEASLDELLPRLANRIRSGTFPVVNRDKNCTGRCAYQTICRVNQIRSLSEHLDKTYDVSSPESMNEEQQ